MDYVIGIDVGTSGVRGLLLDREANLHSVAVREYGMETPQAGWAEQDPQSWWDACLEVLCELCGKIPPSQIKGIGLTGQMHSSVFLDKDDRVVRPALLWCDQRTHDEVDEITSRVGFDRLVELTANRALTGFTAPKVLWLRNHEPANYERLRRLLLPKDYIRSRLTGEYATDVSDASGMLLLDVKNRKWSSELLQALEIDRSILPSLHEGTEVTGTVSAEVSRLTGLSEDTVVMAGGGDQAAGAVGNGIVREGPVLVTIGTSGVVFASSDKPAIDRQARLHSFCHASPGLWHTMGVTLSAGGALQWLRNTLREMKTDLDYSDLEKRAHEAPPAAEGLLFLPYLTGERTPLFDPHARGVFAGLNLNHGIGHLTRAVMEGVAYTLNDAARLMKESGNALEEIYLSGGGARSDLWSAIVANVLGLPIKRLSVDEGPAFGAALLALVGTKAFDTTAEAAEASLKIRDEISPDPETMKVYESSYQRFRELYPALEDHFRGQNGLSGH